MANITQFAKIHASVDENGHLLDTAGKSTNQLLKENEIGICYKYNTLLTRKDTGRKDTDGNKILELVILSSKYENSISKLITLTTIKDATISNAYMESFIVNDIHFKSTNLKKSIFVTLEDQFPPDSTGEIADINAEDTFFLTLNNNKVNDYFIINKKYYGELKLFFWQYDSTNNKFIKYTSDNESLEIVINYTPILEDVSLLG